MKNSLFFTADLLLAVIRYFVMGTYSLHGII